MVPYSILVSGVEKISYVGWSQANTAMLIASISTRYKAVSEMLAKKVNLWAALSPVSYMKHSSSTLLTTLSRFHLAKVIDRLYPYGILQHYEAEDTLETWICRITAGEVCLSPMLS